MYWKILQNVLPGSGAHQVSYLIGTAQVYKLGILIGSERKAVSVAKVGWSAVSSPLFFVRIYLTSPKGSNNPNARRERRNGARNTDVKWWVSGQACGGRLVLGRRVGVRICVYSFPDPTWVGTAECSPQIRNCYWMRLVRRGRKLCSKHSCQQPFAVINIPCCS
jgi:hypothetical protein